MSRGRVFLWIALVTALMAGSFALGYVARRNQWIPRSTRQRIKDLVTSIGRGAAQDDAPRLHTGNWAPAGTAGRRSNADMEAIEPLNALGYLDAYQQPESDVSGVVFSEPEHCYGGYRLYVSGHGPEACLISVDGVQKHSWTVSLSKAFPEVPPHEAYAHRFRRAHVYPDGSLLAIFDLAGLVKLSMDSEIVWTHQGYSHHDLEVQPDGTIYVIDAELRSDGETVHSLVDYITHLSAEGAVLSRFSLEDCFAGSQYAPLLEHSSGGEDILHTNTVHILDECQKALFRELLTEGEAGERQPATERAALVSCRNIDTIALVDLDSQAIVWALTGMWRRQHEPVITDRGTIVLFDNLGLGDRSRVVEVNPLSQATLWSYEGTQENPLNSPAGSACHILPNGNILVVETAPGRATEVTRDKRVVWEFLSPHRVESSGEMLVANLYDMVPLSAEEVAFLRP